jgi:sporulation protein YlmC with PRC-barrel domain
MGSTRPGPARRRIPNGQCGLVSTPPPNGVSGRLTTERRLHVQCCVVGNGCGCCHGLRGNAGRDLAAETASWWRVDRLSLDGHSDFDFRGLEAMTAVLMRGADLIGRPVVDGETGNAVAEIRDVIFDASKGKITGFTLRKRGFLGSRMKQVLPITSVVAIGTDAVMVNGADAFVKADDAPADMTTDRSANVIEDRVIVRDVIVLGGSSPRVVGFEVGGGPAGDGIVSLGMHTALSGSALIVPDSYEHRIRSDLTGHAADLSLIDSGPK